MTAINCLAQEEVVPSMSTEQRKTKVRPSEPRKAVAIPLTVWEKELLLTLGNRLGRISQAATVRLGLLALAEKEDIDLPEREEAAESL